jgi:hypothetical protein
VRPDRDARLIYVAGFVRSATVSLVGVLLAIYLSANGFTASAIGIVIGSGGLKIAYDLLLYRSFRHVRPPEELPREIPRT